MPRPDAVSRPDDPVAERSTPSERIVRIGSGDGVAFVVETLAEMDTVDREYTIACASGERTTAQWTGVPIPALLDATGAPPDSTHLRLESRDGYCVCLPMRDVLDGIVSYARDGKPLADTSAYAFRFLASGVDGDRLVKGVRRIEPIALDGEDDPDQLEAITPAGPTY